MTKHLLLIAFLFAVSLITTSCDPCYKAECINGGTCVDGKCLCADGEERANCEDDPCIYQEPCAHGEKCEQGKCECDEFYSGELCEISVIQSYRGNYVMSSNCSPSYNLIFEVLPSLEGIDKQLRIKETYNGLTFRVNFTSPKDFVINEPNYISGTGGYYQVSGSGTLDSNEFSIIINYEDYYYPYDTYGCLFQSNQ